MESDSLPEECFTDSDEQATGDDSSKTLGTGHTSRGNGPDESSEGDRVGGEDSFGEESARNREGDAVS